jgi:hypothetical protein
MRISISGLLLSLVLTTGAAAQSIPDKPVTTPQAPVKNPQAEAQLKELVGPDGHFSTMMPGTPQYESSAVAMDDGTGTVQMNSFTLEFDNGNVAYILIYSDFPSDRADQPASEVLQGAKAAGVKSAGGSLLSENTIRLGDATGLAFTVHTPDGSFIESHMYYVNGRLYQLMTLAAAGYTATFRDAFMNSFKIK